MKICTQCIAGYPDSQTSCPTHGTLLNEIRDLKPGMIVHKNYKIIRKLGQGGMGAVYLAQHILMDEPRALKFLAPELSADQDFTSRFLREVRTLRRVRNLNVVDCGDLESAEDDSLFFAMEFVDGPDLRTFLRDLSQPIDVSLALAITRGISAGLGAAHAKGMVHRDIKPENILMARNGQSWVPKIADFGIVATRELSNYTQTGLLLLTPYYAAPEQWRGVRASELDCRTDLYALGGVLYEMLTGHKAFNAHDYHGWAQQHLTVEPLAPSSLRPDVADWKGLDSLVLRMLAKDREDRPRDVLELESALDGIVYAPTYRGPPDAGRGSARSRLRSRDTSVHVAAWASSIVVALMVMLAAFLSCRPHGSKTKTVTSSRGIQPPEQAHGKPTSQMPDQRGVQAKRTSSVPPLPTATKAKQETRSANPIPEPPIKNQDVPGKLNRPDPPDQLPKTPPEQPPQSDAISTAAPKSNAVSEPDTTRNETLKPKVRETSIGEVEEKAKRLFDSGQYSDARPLFDEACNGGSGEACSFLGDIFSQGNGVRIDNRQAADFYSLACNAGVASGCSELGYFYLNGFGVEVDYGRAAALSRKGCDAGSVIGCENLGLLYARGDGVPRDDQRADALYAKACDAGVSRGCSHLGEMFLQGRGVRKDIDRGKDLLKKGCSMGDRRACDWVKQIR